MTAQLSRPMPSHRISVHWPSYQNGGSIYYDIIVCKYKPCQKHGYNGNQASNNYRLHILVVESSPGTDFIRQVLTRPGNAFSFLAHGQCWFGVERVLQIAHHNPTALQSNLSRMSSGTTRTLQMSFCSKADLKITCSMPAQAFRQFLQMRLHWTSTSHEHF